MIITINPPNQSSARPLEPRRCCANCRFWTLGPEQEPLRPGWKRCNVAHSELGTETVIHHQANADGQPAWLDTHPAFGCVWWTPK